MTTSWLYSRIRTCLDTALSATETSAVYAACGPKYENGLASNTAGLKLQNRLNGDGEYYISVRDDTCPSDGSRNQQQGPLRRAATILRNSVECTADEGDPSLIRTAFKPLSEDDQILVATVIAHDSFDALNGAILYEKGASAVSRHHDMMVAEHLRSVMRGPLYMTAYARFEADPKDSSRGADSDGL